MISNAHRMRVPNIDYKGSDCDDVFSQPFLLHSLFLGLSIHALRKLCLHQLFLNHLLLPLLKVLVVQPEDTEDKKTNILNFLYVSICKKKRLSNMVSVYAIL